MNKMIVLELHFNQYRQSYRSKMSMSELAFHGISHRRSAARVRKNSQTEIFPRSFLLVMNASH